MGRLEFPRTLNIGIEVMQGLAGSMGVVLTVPITALVSVELIYRKSSQQA